MRNLRSRNRNELRWVRTVVLLALLVIVVTTFIDAQQFPVPETATNSDVSGTPVPDERFANGGVIAAASSGSSSAPWKTIQALGAILVITGVGIGGYILIRKYAPGAIPGTDSRMKVLMRMPIGNRQSIIILRVGDRVLVVGASSGGMKCLSEITDQHEVENLSYGVEFSRERRKVNESVDSEELGDFVEDDEKTSDVQHEIEWLRDRLDGYGEKVEGKVRT